MQRLRHICAAEKLVIDRTVSTLSFVSHICLPTSDDLTIASHHLHIPYLIRCHLRQEHGCLILTAKGLHSHCVSGVLKIHL